ncbi:MAG: acetyl-CoA C-acetyltransferase [Thermoplasmata archaeon]
MREVVIVGAVRTAIGKFQGSLQNIPAAKLGAHVIKEVVKKTGIDGEKIDEVIMGNVVSAGLGQNPARQAMIYADLPVKIGALTINKVCGSGLKAVVLAAQAIKAGDSDIMIAGGMENMNLTPYLLQNGRTGYRLGDGKIVDSMVHDGLWDIYNNFHMGITGEIIAEKYNVTRGDADAFALRSNQRAIKATKEGKFKNEIVSLTLPPAKKGEQPAIFDGDEGPREDTSIEKLSKLKPAFKEGGVVTAGNASQISDGAAALVIMSKEKAKELGIKPMARIVGYHTSGTKPELVMDAPIPCVRELLKKTKLEIDDIDLTEHNEAFSTASVAVSKELGIPVDKFNVNGGAVALGHPIGCSGARILVTLLYAMADKKVNIGLATVCLGGGNAVGMIVERV